MTSETEEDGESGMLFLDWDTEHDRTSEYLEGLDMDKEYPEDWFSVLFDIITGYTYEGGHINLWDECVGCHITDGRIIIHTAEEEEEYE